MNAIVPEDFVAVRRLYDEDMADNVRVHDLVYPEVFGPAEYVGQFSDNSATELLALGRAMGLPAGSRVLDVGCGRGRVAAFLSRSLGWEVIGIDLAGVPLEDARAAAGRTCRFVHGDVYEQPFDRPFDGAYGTGSFCHFDAGRLFRRLAELLRVGGTLAFLERVRLGAIPPDDWDRLTRQWRCPSVYDADEYRALLEASGFGSVRVTDLTRTYRLWQQRSVEARVRLRERIIALSSPDYYETSLRLAAFENEATAAGRLGYALVVASRGG
jgi:SAM-dependent methyltransferase